MGVVAVIGPLKSTVGVDFVAVVIKVQNADLIINEQVVRFVTAVKVDQMVRD